MKIMHKFLGEKNTYEYPDEIDCTFEQLPITLAGYTMFRGKCWSWITYDKVTDQDYEVLLTYTESSVVSHAPSVIGPAAPNVVKCTCGSKSCNHPGHSSYCDVLSVDGWDEAIKDKIAEDKKARDEQKQIDTIWSSYSYF